MSGDFIRIRYKKINGCNDRESKRLIQLMLKLSDNVHNAIRIHHSIATKATDYTKKQHVFRLQTSDQSEYLFQTSDSKELQSWIDTINFVCASFSAPALEGKFFSLKSAFFSNLTF